MNETCKLAFLEEWKASPFNKWRYAILKWLSRKCFRAGWGQYMGNPVPYSVAGMLARYEETHVLYAWFEIGYLRGKWHIEGRPECDICGKTAGIELVMGVRYE